MSLITCTCTDGLTHCCYSCGGFQVAWPQILCTCTHREMYSLLYNMLQLVIPHSDSIASVYIICRSVHGMGVIESLLQEQEIHQLLCVISYFIGSLVLPILGICRWLLNWTLCVCACVCVCVWCYVVNK